jgi:hypothetical protein
VKSLREATKAQQLREGRTCYDHLAGRLGVELTRALIARRLLRRVNGSYVVTRRGEQTLSDSASASRASGARRAALHFPVLIGASAANT